MLGATPGYRQAQAVLDNVSWDYSYPAMIPRRHDTMNRSCRQRSREIERALESAESNPYEGQQRPCLRQPGGQFTVGVAVGVALGSGVLVAVGVFVGAGVSVGNGVLVGVAVGAPPTSG